MSDRVRFISFVHSLRENLQVNLLLHGIIHCLWSFHCGTHSRPFVHHSLSVNRRFTFSYCKILLFEHWIHVIFLNESFLYFFPSFFWWNIFGFFLLTLPFSVSSTINLRWYFKKKQADEVPVFLITSNQISPPYAVWALVRWSASCWTFSSLPSYLRKWTHFICLPTVSAWQCVRGWVSISR